MDFDSKKSKMSMSTVKSTTHTKSMANMVGKSMSRFKVRKQSYGFAGVPGIKNADNLTSQLGLEFKRPPMMFQNTYQLDSRFRFSEPAVMRIIDRVLDAHFTDHQYNVQESPSLTLRLAGQILREVKGLGFNRYRILTIVTMAQKRAQSYNNAIAFLWDHERDSYVNTHREVNSAFIQVTVFGVYLD